MPAGDGILFKYGEYQFDPRPLFTVDKQMVKTPSNTGLGTNYTVTLNGSILPSGIDPMDGNKGGLTKVFDETNSLRDAFSQDFKLFILQCDSDTPIVSGYPRISSIDVANASDNYVRRADYSITLELPSLTGKAYEAGGITCDGDSAGSLQGYGLKSLTDEFNIEFLDEKVGGSLSTFTATTLPSVYSIQRNMTAQGDSTTCIGSYQQPWEKAKAYISDNLGFPSDLGTATGLLCVSGIYLYNNFRNISINKAEGSVTSNETWIASTSSSPYLEEVEVNIERSTESPLTSVNIAGSVQGLTDIDYSSCPPSTSPKYNKALLGWTSVSGLIPSRVSAVYTSGPGNPGGSLNPAALRQSIGYNPIGGSISYNYSYDDRPSLCNTSALTEKIVYNYNDPADVFASVTILGKSSGPLYQQMGTVGPTTRSISIDAVLPLNSVCPGGISGSITPTFYNTLVNLFEASLNGAYSVVFVSDQSVSWEPHIGHFTLNKTWTVGSC